MTVIDRFPGMNAYHWYLRHLIVMPAVEVADQLEKRYEAVVAREFGLPAVVGVRGATSLVRDGQLLTVSGATGLVRLGDS